MNSATPQPRPPAEKIIVLDFGAQYLQLIVRKVQEQGVLAEVCPANTGAADLHAERPSGIILSGGPASVYEPAAPSVDPAIFDLGVPVLGICYGHQLMAHLLGGRVEAGERREYGFTPIEVTQSDLLLAEVESPTQTWMSHGDRVAQAPPGFRVLATSGYTPIAAMGDTDRHLYGVQFHPEVHHTPCGKQVLHNFLRRACGCVSTWEPEDFVEQALQELRTQVGTDRVLCGLSGGVDSSVVAALLERAIGDQLVCMFIDHGLLRKNEAAEVGEFFGPRLGERFVAVDASEVFLERLGGVTDPEEKRQIIGETFIRTFEVEAEKIGTFRFLAQGTIYPDVIESGGGSTATIKSHHNVGGLPENMKYELLEPLRRLFKDQVRQLGRRLGLPASLTERQPFPGPGLAVRIIGEVTPERLMQVREADHIFREELRAAGLETGISQCFAVLADIRSVGVMGDDRSYAHPVILRAVVTEDFMTADWARLPHDLLARAASRIVNEVSGVNRVVYDITSKPPGTVEWE
ncbi:MAG: glutamine-hydrolyzing GMP synthase [candidate division WS1 bacterium]|jgi:GMP synthase (glutamine-hydrolysing)|nr:glutamine-hydrolyzing GMP synthase [candidate division WS1 bacterium]